MIYEIGYENTAAASRTRRASQRRHRESWALPTTATACLDEMRGQVAEGEIAKAVACALELSRLIQIRCSVASCVDGLEGRIRALEATAYRYPRLRRPLAKEVARLRTALDLANGAAHRLCRRGFFSWPRPPGADVLRDIKTALKRETMVPFPPVFDREARRQLAAQDRV